MESSDATRDAAAVWGALFAVFFAIQVAFLAAFRFLPLVGGYRVAAFCCSKGKTQIYVCGWVIAVLVCAAPPALLAVWAARASGGEEHVVALNVGAAALLVLLFVNLAQRKWNASRGAAVLAAAAAAIMLCGPAASVFALEADDRAFSFRAASCAFLSVSLVAVAFVTYLSQPSLDLKSVLSRLFGGEGDDDNDDDGGGGGGGDQQQHRRPEQSVRDRLFGAARLLPLALALLADLGVLAAYAHTVSRLTPDDADAGDEGADTGARHVGWFVAAGTVSYDALVAALVRARLIRASALGVVGVALLCRVGLVLFGQDAWFLGQSLLFVVFFWTVSVAAIRQFYPVEGRAGRLTAFKYARDAVLRKAAPDDDDDGAGAAVTIDIVPEERRLARDTKYGLLAALLVAMTSVFVAVLVLVRADVLWAPATVHDGGSADLEQEAYGLFALAAAVGGAGLYFVLRAFGHAAETATLAAGMRGAAARSAVVCAAIAAAGVALHVGYDARVLSSVLYAWPLAALAGTAALGLWRSAGFRFWVTVPAAAPAPAATRRVKVAQRMEEVVGPDADETNGDGDDDDDGGGAAPAEAPPARVATLTSRAAAEPSVSPSAASWRNPAAAAALLVFFASLAAQGWYLLTATDGDDADALGVSLILGPPALVLTAAPLFSYYRIRVVRRDAAVVFAAGVGSLAGLAGWLPLYPLLLLYPSALFLALALASARAASWRVRAPAAAAAGVSAALLLAYAGVLLADDTDTGLAFLLGVAVVSYLSAVTAVWVSSGFRLPSRVAWATAAVAVLVVAASATVAVRSSRPFFGVSIAWLGAAALCAGWGGYRLVDTAYSRTLYGARFFPVLRFEVDTGRVAPNSAAGAGVLAGAFLAASWGLTAAESLDEPLAGLAVASAALVATAVYVTWAVHSSSVGLARASEHLTRSTVFDIKERAAKRFGLEPDAAAVAGAAAAAAGREDTMQRFADAGLMPHMDAPRRAKLYETALQRFFGFLVPREMGALHAGVRKAQRLYDRQWYREASFLAYYALLLRLSGEFLERQLANDVLDFCNSMGLGGEGETLTAADISGWSPAVCAALAEHVAGVRRDRERRDRILKRQLQAGGSGGGRKRARVNVCATVFPLLGDDDARRAKAFVAEQRRRRDATGELFVDEDMAPYAVRGKYGRWVRGSDLYADTGTVIFRGRPTATDVKQGALGTCWLMAALAVAASLEPEALERAFMCHEEALACGMALVRLNFDGVWWAVAVDDRLPTSDGKRATLAVSAEPGELWVSLIEKACAKLFHGAGNGYEELGGGSSSEALALLTGNPSRTLHLEASSADVLTGTLWLSLLRMHGAGFFLGVASAGESDDHVSEEGNIVQNHAFSLLDVRDAGGFHLLKLRNPWHTGEWTGAWSDESEEWNRHPEVARELGLVKADDGIFWMDFESFSRHFDLVYMAMAGRPSEHTVTFRHSVDAALYAGGSGTGRGGEHCPQAWLTVTRPVDIGLRVRIPAPGQREPAERKDDDEEKGAPEEEKKEEEGRTIFVLAMAEGGGKGRLGGVSYSDPCLYVPSHRLSDNNVTFVAEPGVYHLAVLWSGGSSRPADAYPVTLTAFTRGEDSDAVLLEEVPPASSGVPVRSASGGTKVFPRY